MDAVSLNNLSGQTQPSGIYQGQVGSSRVTSVVPSPDSSSIDSKNNTASATIYGDSQQNENMRLSVAYDSDMHTMVFTKKDMRTGQTIEQIPEKLAVNVVNDLKASGKSAVGAIVNTTS